MIIRVAVRAPVMLLFSLGMAFSISARLSLVFLCVIPVLGLGLFLLARKAHPIFERVFLTYDKLNNVVQENLRGIRVVKSFVREDHEIEKFGKVSDTIYRDFSRAEKTVACNMPLMQLCLYTCMLLISWIGAKLIVGSSMTTGQLVSLISYAMQILMSLMMLSMILVMVTIARTSAERTAELLDEDSSLQNPAAPITHVQDGAVAFEGVYSSDMETLCRRDVSFSIPSGHTVGILGGTGSSKSTLVQLIPRLYDATSGRVLVGGVDVRAYDMESLRENVAMVLQKNELFSGTIRENLLLADPDAKDAALLEALEEAGLGAFIRSQSKGLDSDVGNAGSSLSGGQRQKMGIARALLSRAEYMIFDEATSSVDPQSEKEIWETIGHLAESRTLIIISHRMSSVQNADCIYVLRDGRVAQHGTHEVLMAEAGLYKELVVRQQAMEVAE